jgi:hypothetical protein
MQACRKDTYKLRLKFKPPSKNGDLLQEMDGADLKLTKQIHNKIK